MLQSNKKIGGTIVKINKNDVVIKTPAGKMYNGFLRETSIKWYTLKTGDTVGFSVQWNDVLDAVLIKSIVKRRKGK